MAFGSESEPHISPDFVINKYDNASANYDIIGIDQIPFSLGISGIIPFNIGSSASESAYVSSKGKTSSTGG